MSNKLLSIGILVVLLDQITKYIMKTKYVVSRNYGAAFGLFQGGRWFFVLIAFLVIYLAYKYRSSYNQIGLGLLIGGTVGNLIDRLYLGYVIDFIDFGFWPSFNLADSASTIGVVLLIYLHWKEG